MTKVHLSAVVRGEPQATRARCGWTHVQTTTDISKVTCKLCQKLHAAGTTARARERQERSMSDELSDALLEIAGVPAAPPPPRFDPAAWQTVCRPDPEIQNRCGNCALCEYERRLDRLADLDPWRTRKRPEFEHDAPAFGSLNAALVALAEWRARDRHAVSQLGRLLDRLRLGQTGGSNPVGNRNRLLDLAEDIAHVERALREAFAYGENAAGLPPKLAEALLLVRTPGVVPGEPPNYVEIAARLLEQDYAATPRTLKRTVRHGRRVVTVELAARGLLRRPAPDAGLAEAIWKREQELGEAHGAS